LRKPTQIPINVWMAALLELNPRAYETLLTRPDGELIIATTESMESDG
jgi:hypothetical protein